MKKMQNAARIQEVCLQSIHGKQLFA
jgi:hypothetical protein